MNILKTKRGFTLIELLVVIAIIGILAALIIVSLSSARGRAQDAQRKNNARTINSALEQYAVDNSGGYPGDGQATATTGVALATACGSGGVLNVLFGTGLYIQNTNVCNDPTTLARLYNANQQNSPATAYHIVWQLASQSEALTTSGNGVYSSDGTGAIVVGGITTNTGVNSTRFFGVYGPQ